MDEARRLHKEAMRLAFEGDLAQGILDDVAVEEYRKAYGLEAQAARMIPAGTEPTRSVLFRSAASLAMCAGDYQASLELIEEGRSDTAPGEIMYEMDELEAEVKWKRRLAWTRFVPVKLILTDWRRDDRSVYANADVDVASGVFHAGSTFDGGIVVGTADQEGELKQVLADGYEPMFAMKARE